MGALPAEVIQLQEEMNTAMVQLLTTRVSMDTYCWKQVLYFEMAFCQNEVQTTKAIRETKAAEQPLGRQRPAPLQLLGSQRPITQWLLGRQRPPVPQLLERQRLPVQVMPTPCNNCIVTTCSA